MQVAWIKSETNIYERNDTRTIISEFDKRRYYILFEGKGISSPRCRAQPNEGSTTVVFWPQQ